MGIDIVEFILRSNHWICSIVNLVVFFAPWPADGCDSIVIVFNFNSCLTILVIWTFFSDLELGNVSGSILNCSERPSIPCMILPNEIDSISGWIRDSDIVLSILIPGFNLR